MANSLYFLGACFALLAPGRRSYLLLRAAMVLEFIERPPRAAKG